MLKNTLLLCCETTVKSLQFKVVFIQVKGFHFQSMLKQLLINFKCKVYFYIVFLSQFFFTPHLNVIYF